MTPDLSPAEYRALLDLLFIGDTVLHSYAGDRPETETHRRALDKLLDQADAYGCGDWRERRDEGGWGFTERMERESRANEWLEDFEDRTFWEQLIQRLADRDLRRRGEAADGEPDAAQQRRRRLAERGYAREFDINGLDHVELARPLHGRQ